MKKIILASILVVFVIGILSASNIYNYYKIDLNYNKGELTLLSTNIEQSLSLINNSFGEYRATLLDYENNMLYVSFFKIPNKVLYDEVDENGTISGGGEIELKEVNFTLFIPYYENASKIVIYDENVTKKLEIDVGFYSKDYKEFNAINKNTPNENESTNQGNTQVDENVIREETFIEKISYYWWVLLIILIILLAIIINYIRK